MATIQDVKNQISNLITKSNDKTGANSTDLTSAVDVLISGFGGGSGTTTIIKSGTYKASGTGVQTISHGLGAVPDFIHIAPTTSLSGGSGLVFTSIFGFHSKFNLENPQSATTTLAAGLSGSKKSTIDASSNDMGLIRSANETTFTVGGGYVSHISGKEYHWFAIAGLK